MNQIAKEAIRSLVDILTFVSISTFWAYGVVIEAPKLLTALATSPNWFLSAPETSILVVGALIGSYLWFLFRWNFLYYGKDPLTDSDTN